MTGRKVFDQMVAFLKTQEGKTLTPKAATGTYSSSSQDRKGELNKKLLNSNLSIMLGL